MVGKGSVTTSQISASRILSAREMTGWGGRIRTSAWGNQNPLPYHLATPHRAGPSGWKAGPEPWART